MSHNSRKIHKICKWSFRRTGKLFVFFVCWSLCGLLAFMGQCSAIFFTSESKIVEEVKINLGGALKDALSRRKMHFFFANALRCWHFPNFPPDIFLKTQRHLFVVIIFKTEESKEFNFWKDFHFALSANYLLQRHATHVCFHISIWVIIHHQNTDRLELLWRTKASGHTIVLPRENHR